MAKRQQSIREAQTGQEARKIQVGLEVELVELKAGTGAEPGVELIEPVAVESAA